MKQEACARVLRGQTPVEVGAALDVSPSSVRRWSARVAGGEGLADRPRQGRPRIQDTADQVVASVLATAGARIDSSDFSTRAIAAATGLSQSVVARTTARLAVPADAPAVRLTLVAVSFPVLAVGFSDLDQPAQRSRPPRSFSRRGAGFVAALHSAGLSRWVQRYGADGDAALPSDVYDAVEQVRPDALLIFDPRAVLEGVGREDFKLLPERSVHSELAAFLAAVRTALGTVVEIPGSLLKALSGRVTRGLEGLLWTADEPTDVRMTAITSDSSNVVPDSNWLPRENLSLTEQLAIALRQEIIDSGYRAGDRIRPAHLAARLELPRSAVDAALRRMIDEELLDGSRGGVRIPSVTAVDVLDLYAARQALGTVLLRRLADRPKRYLVPVRQALRRVEAAAGMRRGAEVDDADLRFQQELARASGLEQTARTFESLTRRLRMYISVLLLDYAPATERIVLDDRRILHALEAGDAAAAVDAWRGKLDNAVRHMAGIAQYRGFDVQLWTRLTTG